MTNATRIDAFPIPLFTFDMSSETDDLNKELLRETQIALRGQTETRTGVDAVQTVAGLENQYSSFAALQGIISEVSTQLLERGCVAEPLWTKMITEPHGYHMPHSHRIGNYMWNGIYFPMSLDGPPVNSSSQPPAGSLVLLDPLEFVKSGVADEKTERYPYWGNPICITPKAGTLVLFPVYLPHMVAPVGKQMIETSDSYRTSVAFYLRFV